MKMWDEVYHKLKADVSEKMIVIGLKEHKIGKKVKCRRYDSCQKEFKEVTFHEDELVLVDEYLKPYKTLEEEIQFWKDSIVVDKDALKKAEERLKSESE